MAELLEGWRPPATRPERCEQPAPPRQAVVTLQIDGEPESVLLKDKASGRTALLGVEAVGDGNGHDAVGPVLSGKLFPVGAGQDAARASQQPSQEAVPAHISISSELAASR